MARIATPYRVEVTFKTSRNKNWVPMELLIHSDNADDGETAELFVHDSFLPNLFTLLFSAGVARQTVTSWGRFTVGVWIPDRNVERELDLALVRGAPEIIRTG